MASSGADKQEDTQVANLAKKAQEKATEVPSQARSAPSERAGDASPTGSHCSHINVEYHTILEGLMGPKPQLPLKISSLPRPIIVEK